MLVFDELHKNRKWKNFLAYMSRVRAPANRAASLDSRKSRQAAINRSPIPPRVT
jgi:hypothetical protein